MNGKVYISVDALERMLDQIIETRDEMVASDPEIEQLVPGSDATVAFLRRTFDKIKARHAGAMDMAEATEELIKEIYEFLRRF